MIKFFVVLLSFLSFSCVSSGVKTVEVEELVKTEQALAEFFVGVGEVAGGMTLSLYIGDPDDTKCQTAIAKSLKANPLPGDIAMVFTPINQPPLVSNPLTYSAVFFEVQPGKGLLVVVWDESDQLVNKLLVGMESKVCYKEGVAVHSKSNTKYLYTVLRISQKE